MAINEYPSIRIDDFRLDSKAPAPELCFLTHMHEDHTNGLARKSYYGPIVYCTAATRALLLNFRTHAGTGELKYNHLRKEVCGKEILKTLELNRPYEFELRSGALIQVTLIDANHCPGAAMVLIKSLQDVCNAVLYTGDLRCETWHLNSLKHTPQLFDYQPALGGSKTLSLYVDDTFMSHVDPYKSYIENHSGIEELTALLATYPREVHFCLTDRVTGLEEVLIALAQTFQSKVHMDAYAYNIYQLAADTSPLARNLLDHCTMDFTPNVRVHFCQKNMACPMREPHSPMAYLKPCNQPTRKIVNLQNAQHLAATMPLGIMEPFEENSHVFKGPDQRYFYDQATRKFYPLFPWFYFSRHASFPEVRRLRDMFNTKSVRSLAGDLIESLNPAVNVVSKPSMDSNPLVVNRARRVTSLAVGNALIKSTEGLPVLAKKPKMPQFYDRLKLQQARAKRNRHDSVSSGSDSDSDDDRHNAMMLLGQRNALDAKVRKISTENECHADDYDNGFPRESSPAKSLAEAASQTALDIQAESLPSPPDSPSHEPAASPDLNECQYICDTLDDEREVAFNALVDKLRNNPDAWFDLRENGPGSSACIYS